MKLYTGFYSSWKYISTQSTSRISSSTHMVLCTVILWNKNSEKSGYGRQSDRFTHFFKTASKDFSLTEVPENKIKKTIIVILLSSEGVQLCPFFLINEIKEKKEEPKIHTPFTHADKKTDTKWNDIKKFSKTFHTETFFLFLFFMFFLNGWMDEYKNKEVCNIKVCFGLWRTCSLLVWFFNMTFWNIWINGRCSVARTVFKIKNQPNQVVVLKVTQTSDCGGNIRSWYD